MKRTTHVKKDKILAQVNHGMTIVDAAEKLWQKQN